MEYYTWVLENYGKVLVILAGVISGLEVIVRLTPTTKDDGFVQRAGEVIKKLMDLLKVPNVKKK